MKLLMQRFIQTQIINVRIMYTPPQDFSSAIQRVGKLILRRRRAKKEVCVPGGFKEGTRGARQCCNAGRWQTKEVSRFACRKVGSAGTQRDTGPRRRCLDAIPLVLGRSLLLGKQFGGCELGRGLARRIVKREFVTGSPAKDRNSVQHHEQVLHP